MWRSRRDRDSVTCPACGRSLTRSGAREYDKHGDRWDRDEKSFEYLCKSCHSALCHQNRDELESLLTEIDAGSVERAEFLARYCATVEERYGSLEEQ
ncbi:MAG: hypothetical protein ABEJ48_06915 [Halobacteriales archaeon]